jgi:hypothetical protein
MQQQQKKWANKLLNKNKRNWQKARKQNEGGDDKKLQWVMGNEAYHLWKEKLPILRVGNTHDRVESWSERREKKNHSDLRVKRRDEKTYHSLFDWEGRLHIGNKLPTQPHSLPLEKPSNEEEIWTHADADVPCKLFICEMLDTIDVVAVLQKKFRLACLEFKVTFSCLNVCFICINVLCVHFLTS